MPGTKAFTVLRDVLLDGHVRITKAHELHLPAFLSQDSGLLRGAWRRLRLVVPGKFLASVGNHLAFGSTYHPAGRVTRLGPESLPSLSNA